MEAEGLLAEIEDILRSAPPRATIRHGTPENLGWLGRAVATITRWDSIKGVTARSCATQLQGGAPMTHLGDQAYGGLMLLLNEARSDLRMATLGPVNTAIGHGLVFEYFDEMRKIIAAAKEELFFVDPYLDAEFVSRYLPQVPVGVTVRLLAREKVASLVPAAAAYVAQHKIALSIRSAPNFHDRYFFVDHSACYQSGASFKDGAKTAPTTISQIIDAFAAVQQTYEALWNGGKSEF
jgi:hypothetical protein